MPCRFSTNLNPAWLIPYWNISKICFLLGLHFIFENLAFIVKKYLYLLSLFQLFTCRKKITTKKIHINVHANHFFFTLFGYINCMAVSLSTFNSILTRIERSHMSMHYQALSGEACNHLYMHSYTCKGV